MLSGVSIGNYAVFAGGYLAAENEAGNASRTVDAYDSQLVKYPDSITSLSTQRYYVSTANAGDYGLFAGGWYATYSSGDYNNDVDAFDTNLSKIESVVGLARDRAPCSGTVGEYGVFIGGMHNQSGSISPQNYIDVYDGDLTRVVSEPMQNQMWQRDGVGGNLPNYVITDRGINVDEDLVQNQADNLEMGPYGMAAAPVGPYLIFGGGKRSNNSSQKEMKYFNNDLTSGLVYTTTYGKRNGSAVSLGDYAVFLGGWDTGAPNQGKVMWTVDEDLVFTEKILDENVARRWDGAIACAGDYALFAGGFGAGYYSNDPRDLVEVYTLE